MKVPDSWQRHIEAGTPFGQKAQKVLEAAKKRTKVVHPKLKQSTIGDNLHAIIMRETGNAVPCSECKAEIDRLNMMTAEQVLLDTIPLSERIVARSAKNAQKWYQRAAAKFLPGMVAARVRTWIVEACGIPSMPHIVLPKETLCGCIHDSQVAAFRDYIVPIVPGVRFMTPLPSFTSHRRVLDTQGHYELLRSEVIKWNGGLERPAEDLPYIRGTWEYAVTTVPSRVDDLLPRTLESLADAGFDKPIISVDGPCDSRLVDVLEPHEVICRGRNIRTFAHWHMTLLELYSRNPWSQFYAIFQDDFICVKNLKHYLTECTLPEKSYLNLFTFMENDAIVPGKTHGWHEAARAAQGHQLGRGAVALVFSHAAVETLLAQPHMVTRRRDSMRGHKSLDGAIVESMNAAGWTEYIHYPSLVQHIGEESSMGNKKHPISKCYIEEFDPLSLLPPK
jgi:hypothetical protein